MACLYSLSSMFLTDYVQPLGRRWLVDLSYVSDKESPGYSSVCKTLIELRGA